MTVGILPFAILAGLTLAGALVAVLARNIIHAAVALAFTFFFIAGLYVLLGNPLLAVIQFAVNAAAIPILTIFVIMTTQTRSVKPANAALLGTAALFGVLFLWGLWQYLGFGATKVHPVPPAGFGGRLLGFTLLPFEIASVLLLLAMVGAIVLARRLEK